MRGQGRKEVLGDPLDGFADELAALGPLAALDVVQAHVVRPVRAVDETARVLADGHGADADGLSAGSGNVSGEVADAGILPRKDELAEVVLQALVEHQLQEDAAREDGALLLVVAGEDHERAFAVGDLVDRVQEREVGGLSAATEGLQKHRLVLDGADLSQSLWIFEYSAGT